MDNCCYNRPYDDQSQIRISLETQAKIYIQDKISKHELELASSYVLMAENDANQSEAKKDSIRNFIEDNSTVFVDIKHMDEIKEMIIPIMASGIKYADASHIACALFSKCDYFITTDKRVLKYQTESIKLRNPITLIAEMEDEL